jgi:hypothetical protein
MKRLLIATISILSIATATFALPPSSQAQVANIKEISSKIPTSRVTFKKGTSSAHIQGASNRIYLLRANAGQKMTIKINSLGARASVTLYGVNGKPIGQSIGGFDGENKTVSFTLPKTGDYSIVGGSGPTNHFYDFTVSIK